MPGSLRRRPRAAVRPSERGQALRKSLPLPVLFFLWSLPLPWDFSIGIISLRPYKIVLIVMFVPCLLMWLRGAAGRIRLPDIALLLFCLWCTLAIIVIHGASAAIEPGGVIFVETMGAYLLARCYIRDADDFYNVVRTLFIIVAILLPFAIIETVSGRNVFKELMAMVLPSYIDVDMDPRWGLKRVQLGFRHPILFGVFAGSILALVHLVLGYGQPMIRRWMKSGIVVATAFLSLSAGPLSAVAAQCMLLGWRWLVRNVTHGWGLLIGGACCIVFVLELLANRSLPVIFIGMFAFDEASAYVRILIWRFGTESIANHPLFGVGFGEWDRPEWMPSSIDMHWIIDMVRHGIPAGVFLLLAFFSAIIAVALKKGLDDRTNSYRTAYVITMIGFFVAGWTVYIWMANYAMMMFLLAAGLWMLDLEPPQDASGRRHQPKRVGRTGRRPAVLPPSEKPAPPMPPH